MNSLTESLCTLEKLAKGNAKAFHDYMNTTNVS